MPADAAVLAYVDTSVLVRSYVVEPGTGEARQTLEMIEARVRESRGFWTLLDVDGRVLQRAEDELRRGAPLHALDAVHLATAFTFQAEAGVRLPFITGDEQQRRAGLALGLAVVFVE